MDHSMRNSPSNNQYAGNDSTSPTIGLTAMAMATTASTRALAPMHFQVKLSLREAASCLM